MALWVDRPLPPGKQMPRRGSRRRDGQGRRRPNVAFGRSPSGARGAIRLLTAPSRGCTSAASAIAERV